MRCQALAARPPNPQGARRRTSATAGPPQHGQERPESPHSYARKLCGRWKSAAADQNEVTGAQRGPERGLTDQTVDRRTRMRQTTRTWTGRGSRLTVRGSGTGIWPAGNCRARRTIHNHMLRQLRRFMLILPLPFCDSAQQFSSFGRPSSILKQTDRGPRPNIFSKAGAPLSSRKLVAHRSPPTCKVQWRQSEKASDPTVIYHLIPPCQISCDGGGEQGEQDRRQTTDSWERSGSVLIKTFSCFLSGSPTPRSSGSFSSSVGIGSVLGCHFPPSHHRLVPPNLHISHRTRVHTRTRVPAHATRTGIGLACAPIALPPAGNHPQAAQDKREFCHIITATLPGRPPTLSFPLPRKLDCDIKQIWASAHESHPRITVTSPHIRRRQNRADWIGLSSPDFSSLPQLVTSAAWDVAR